YARPRLRQSTQRSGRRRQPRKTREQSAAAIQHGSPHFVIAMRTGDRILTEDVGKRPQSHGLKRRNSIPFLAPPISSHANSFDSVESGFLYAVISPNQPALLASDEPELDFFCGGHLNCSKLSRSVAPLLPSPHFSHKVGGTIPARGLGNMHAINQS